MHRDPGRWGQRSPWMAGMVKEGFWGDGSWDEGFPSQSGPAERALQAAETKCAQAHQEERFCRIDSTTSSSGTVFIHQTFPTILGFHMYVRGTVEEWLDGSEAGEMSRDSDIGSPFWCIEGEPSPKDTGSHWRILSEGLTWSASPRFWELRTSPAF